MMHRKSPNLANSNGSPVACDTIAKEVLESMLGGETERSLVPVAGRCLRKAGGLA
jgi:hypothetical protein